mgnify:CR=1 FL=1
MRPIDLQRLLLSYNKPPSYAIQQCIINALNNNDLARLLMSMESVYLHPIEPWTTEKLADAVQHTFGTHIDTHNI